MQLADRRILESELLVVQFQQGDEKAFEQLIRLWERPLFYYLRRLAVTEADAWDLLQETWLKALISLGKLREPRTLPAFLYRVARNTAISRRRFEASRESVAAAANEQAMDDLPTSEDGLAGFDDAEQVHYALDQLPLLQREAMVLYFLQDLSQEQMAELLGVPVGTVKSRLHHAKGAMRRILQETRCEQE